MAFLHLRFLFRFQCVYPATVVTVPNVFHIPQDVLKHQLWLKSMMLRGVTRGIFFCVCFPQDFPFFF